MFGGKGGGRGLLVGMILERYIERTARENDKRERTRNTHANRPPLFPPPPTGTTPTNVRLRTLRVTGVARSSSRSTSRASAGS